MLRKNKYQPRIIDMLKWSRDKIKVFLVTKGQRMYCPYILANMHKSMYFSKKKSEYRGKHGMQEMKNENRK